jgi:rare lipoprotein A
MSGVAARRCRIAALLCVALASAGCAGKRPLARRPPPPSAPAPSPPAAKVPTGTPAPSTPPAAPGSFFEEGLASWYGVPYHGRRASNGEVYDMHKMTAAHRTLPFETIIRVTNLKNGRQAEVRIIDRGPFVEGRILDLSLAAARELDLVRDGVVRVRLDLLSGPHPAAGQFTVQIGAFARRENAVRLRQSLERKYQPVFVVEFTAEKGLLYRVRVGRVASEMAAERLADKLRREENILHSFILRLDDE